MTREIAAGTKAESKKTSGGATAVGFVELMTDSGPVRYWSGRGPIDFNGETFLGVGDKGKVSEIEEETEVRSYGIVIELSGIPQANIAMALNEPLQGRKASLWLGFVNDDRQLVDTPLLLFKGRMDNSEGMLGDTGTVSVAVESRLADWGRPRIRLYTSASHNERWPSDKFFDFVAETVEREINWGGQVAGGQGGGVVPAGLGTGDGSNKGAGNVNKNPPIQTGGRRGG